MEIACVLVLLVDLVCEYLYFWSTWYAKHDLFHLLLSVSFTRFFLESSCPSVAFQAWRMSGGGGGGGFTRLFESSTNTSRTSAAQSARYFLIAGAVFSSNSRTDNCCPTHHL